MGFLRLPPAADHFATLALLIAASYLSKKDISLGLIIGLLMVAFVACRFGDFIHRSYLTFGRDMR